MARVLLSYHYGGLYLDLDFYCHRPYHCLINKAIEQVHSILSKTTITNANNSKGLETHPKQKLLKDVLIVSREPEVHAILMHNKPRIIIQDFYMATPKHPFFLWFLENQLALFHDSQGFPPTGPFSYHIEGHIDNYYVFKSCFGTTSGRCADRQFASNNMTKHIAEFNDDLIIELEHSITHPLLDSTNTKLTTKCAQLKKSPFWSSSSGSQNISILQELQIKSCKTIEKKIFFAPSDDTVLVHMWTHVYLGVQLFIFNDYYCYYCYFFNMDVS